MRAHLSLLLLAPLLAACPNHEGPIDVILVDMDETAEITWAEAGSQEFQPCGNEPTDPDAVAACGPYGVGDPGDYVVRVTWTGVTLDKEVTLEKDGSYQANTSVTFSAEEFQATTD